VHEESAARYILHDPGWRAPPIQISQLIRRAWRGARRFSLPALRWGFLGDWIDAGGRRLDRAALSTR
jgi:hypothetical protein